MKTTTLNKIRSFSPCEPSWVKLLKSLNKTQADDEELSFRHIYETLGILDTIWCLRTLDDLSYCVEIAKYAARAASDAADADALAAYAARAAARAYADCIAGYVTAVDAAVDAAGYAAYAAGYAARAATYVDCASVDAAVAAGDAARKEALVAIGVHLMKLLENER